LSFSESQSSPDLNKVPFYGHVIRLYFGFRPTGSVKCKLSR